MKVALLVEPSPIEHVSGMQTRFRFLLDGLKARGHTALLGTPIAETSVASDLPSTYCGAQVVTLPSLPLPSYAGRTLTLSHGLSLSLLRALWKQQPHVVHSVATGILGIAAAYYAQWLQVPYVVSYHTHIPMYCYKYHKNIGALLELSAWMLVRWPVRAADLTLVMSSAMKEELVRRGCPAEKIAVWRRAVDTAAFNPAHRSAAMRARLTGGDPDAPPGSVLLFVGRLGPEKNLPDLVPVLRGNPGLRLALVGDGPLREQLQQAFAGLPVAFMGMLHGEELGQAYASADIFVAPSDTETLGFVVMEAMASGLPVVACGARGFLDTIPPHNQGVTGYLYPPGDLESAAACVGKLAADGELRACMGAAARQDAEAHSWGQSIDCVCEHYQRLIKEAPLKRYSAADVLLYLMGLVVFPAGVATWLVLSLARACNDAKTFLWNACTNMVWQSSRQIHMQAKPMQHAGPASSDKQQ